MITLIICIAFLIICIKIGDEKNRFGLLYGLVLGPLGLILLIVLPPLNKSPVSPFNSRSASDSEKKCTTCGSFVDATCNKCPECGSLIYIATQPDLVINNLQPFIPSETNKTCTIICPYCSKKQILSMPANEFSAIKCEKCHKTINNKNVIFE